jgi:hypothetical protein
MLSQTKVRLERLLDERSRINELHEQVILDAESRSDPVLTEPERETIRGYMTRCEVIDAEVTELHKTVEAEEKAAEASKVVRANLAGNKHGVADKDGDGSVKYRSFAAYARDVILTKRGDTFDKIAMEMGGEAARAEARERLMRAPLHTLSSDVPGLIPAQHIAQLMDVINDDRPVIQSAFKVDLERGVINFPQITQRPQVLQQGTEKTEGGTLDMQIAMGAGTAVTFIGGGNLSWQAVNWSSPSALEMWFRLAAEQFARKTETYVAGVLGSAAISGGTISGTVAGTSSYSQWITAVAAGASAIYTDSNGGMADTLYLSPDMFFTLAGKTSDQGVSLINVGQLNIGTLGGNIAGLNVVTSYGLGTNFAALGDSDAFLVAETAGAPVELRAVEPSIGGLEVGVIGAIAAKAIDVTRFTKIMA